MCIKKKGIVFLLVFFLFFCALSFYSCQKSTSEPHFPEYYGYVNDFASVFDNKSVESMTNIITSLERSTGAEIAVVTVGSLEGLTIEEYAEKLFKKWGIGKKGSDNGVLLLIALKEHELRIEVGYGLEGTITDLESGRIINDIIVPFFRENNYGAGAFNGVVALANEIYKEKGMATLEQSATTSMGEKEQETTGSISSGKSSGSKSDAWYFFLCCFPVIPIFIIISIIINVFKRRCPRCKKFTLKIQEKILEQPTYIRRGKKLVIRDCTNCGYHDEKIVNIPRKGISGGGTGGTGGFGGGSSGGGFGGFGGGSSGGGGASGRW